MYDNEKIVALLLFFAILILWVVIHKTRMEVGMKLFLALLFSFQGLSIIIFPNKIPWYFGLFIFLFSTYSFFIISKTVKVKSPKELNIASDIIKFFSANGQYVRFFPMIGIIMISFDIIANIFYFNGRIGGNDLVFILTGFTWLLYSYLPSNYFRERDFVFIFINMLTLLVVLPSTIYNLTQESTLDGYSSPAEVLVVNFFLAKPLSFILNFFGYDSFALGEVLKYRLIDGSLSQVSIAQGCSGLYSVAIFVSAFIAFISTEYQKFDLQVLALLLTGIIIAYIANLFRMVIIVIVGIHKGPEALFWAHANAGWLIFIFWIWLFWSLLSRFLDTSKDKNI